MSKKQKTSQCRISNEILVRNREAEKSFGIQDLKFYLFQDEYGLHINGEIIGKRLTSSITFQFTAYDEDGDVLISSDNRHYGGTGFCTATIHRENFFDGFPFSCYFCNEDWEGAKKIRVQVMGEER